MSEEAVKIELVNFNKLTPISNKPKISGTEQNGQGDLIIYVDVSTYLLKDYGPSRASTEKEKHQYYSFKLVFNTGEVNVYRVYGDYSMITILPNEKDNQLAVIMRLWPPGLKEVDFKLIDNSQKPEEIKNVQAH